jgi:thymidylate synthase (FAD)
MWKASDGIGSIEVLEVFGNDLTVVNAARVSFAKESKEFVERDAGLINYLAKHQHTSPFFHPQIRLRVKMPIFVAREWYRHTIGFARNEVSRRYVDSVPECWNPSVEDLRERDPKLKQGSKAEAAPLAEKYHKRVTEFQALAVELYGSMVADQIAPEVARCILPQSMYTEFIETGSLAAYARLCGLRLSPEAQKEIRLYAGGLSELLAPRFPVSWAALHL